MLSGQHVDSRATQWVCRPPALHGKHSSKLVGADSDEVANCLHQAAAVFSVVTGTHTLLVLLVVVVVVCVLIGAAVRPAPFGLAMLWLSLSGVTECQQQLMQ